jgi:hypothetical protein
MDLMLRKKALPMKNKITSSPFRWTEKLTTGVTELITWEL